MKVKRLFTTLAVITCAGIAVARSGELVPSARQVAQEIMSGEPDAAAPPALPDFAGGAKDLQFNAPAASSASANGPAEAGGPVPPPPVAAKPATPSNPAKRTATGSAVPGSENSGKSAALSEQARLPAVTVDGEKVQQKSAKNIEPSNARPVPITVEPIDPEDPSIGASKTRAEAPPVPAKTLFGAAKTPSPLAARAIGGYSRGCLSGGVALPVDGSAWQAMRLSRNRNWGHPNLVRLVEKLAIESKDNGIWPGLLVGDLSQPRGGPMLTGHASHQVGLDADVWLTPMPNRKLTKREREDISATSMLDKTDLAVDPKVFTDKQVQLIKRAASYPQVERVFVHPAIKKALCVAAGADRLWLGKVRPMGGHYYHFHIRIACPPGSEAYCKPQKAVTGDDGCTTEVEEWLARLKPSPPKPHPPGWKPKPPPPPISMAQLPSECGTVLASGPDGIVAPPSEKPTVASTVAKEHPALNRQLMKMRSAKQ